MNNHHLVLQVWAHESKHYIRLQTIPNNVKEFVSSLTETYESDPGFIKVFYYLEPISVELMKKLVSYFELFYDAIEIIPGAVFETRKEHPTGEEVVKVIRKIIKASDPINLRASLALTEAQLADILSVDNNPDDCQLHETPKHKRDLWTKCDFSYQAFAEETLKNAPFTNVTPLSITIHKGNYEEDTTSKEFPILINSRTLSAIVKRAVLHFSKDTILCASNPISSQVIHISPHDGIRIKSTSLSFDYQDLSYVFTMIDGHQSSCLIDTIYTLAPVSKWSWESWDPDHGRYHTVQDMFDLQAPRNLSYEPMFKKIMGDFCKRPSNTIPVDPKVPQETPVDSHLDEYYDLPSVSKYAGKSAAIPPVFKIGEEFMTPDQNPDGIFTTMKSVITSSPESNCHPTPILYIKNSITNECKLITQSVPLLSEQIVLHSVESQNAEATIRVVSNLFDHVTHQLEVADSFDKSPNASSLFMAILSQHLAPRTSPTSSTPSTQSPTCVCDLCTRPQLKLSDITQHQLIQHFISQLRIQSETEWSTSSELQAKIEDFIKTVHVFLQSKRPSNTIAMNKNQVSQSVSDFLTKKRRVVGMTFNCTLPSDKEVLCLADTTFELINQKLSDINKNNCT